MVSIIKRMVKLRALLGIRLGPGAVVLPSEVKRIHMDFAYKMNDGHNGPRKFWRDCLPRLKYHNPAVPMTVNRTTAQEGPATMTIFFAETNSSNTPAAPISSTTQASTSTEPVIPTIADSEVERTETIEMKHKHSTEILAQLLEVTRGRQVEATPEEEDQLRQLEEQRKTSEIDSKRSLAHKAEVKKREAILAQASGQLAQAEVA
ncbi:MAG: hypothetical protein M1817_002672 [Caeruleum heppii]|nr:MAG: hypothetical protein M1817_002672 [Caeruleum heppii]